MDAIQINEAPNDKIVQFRSKITRGSASITFTYTIYPCLPGSARLDPPLWISYWIPFTPSASDLDPGTAAIPHHETLLLQKCFGLLFFSAPSIAHCASLPHCLAQLHCCVAFVLAHVRIHVRHCECKLPMVKPGCDFNLWTSFGCCVFVCIYLLWNTK